MPGPIRLNKVLKELNISLDRAVEFLNSKDIKIDARPTTKIDQKIYDLLSSEFEAYKSEKDVLDKINIQKRKEIEAKEILDKKDELKETEKKDDGAQNIKELKKEDKSNQGTKDSKSSESEKEDKKYNKIETQFQKLSGLKKTGETLDLDTIKKDKKETSSDDSKKRKRKRISKGAIKDK